jgi:hypothetical protein
MAIFGSKCVVMLSVAFVIVMLSVLIGYVVMLNINFYCYDKCHYAECHYAECHFAKCHYAECHYAECHYAEGHFA